MRRPELLRPNFLQNRSAETFAWWKLDVTRASEPRVAHGEESNLGDLPGRPAGPALGDPVRMGLIPFCDLGRRTHQALHRRQVLGRVDQAHVLATRGIRDEADRDEKLDHVAPQVSCRPL